MEKQILITDQDNNVVGSAPRADAVVKGLWHRIVVVLVFNSKGQLYIQKRSPHAPSSPNLWDHSAAGHVDAGEEPEEADMRELKEELGIEADKLNRIATYKTQRSVGDKHYNRYWYLYALVYDGTFKLQEEEVAEGEFVDISWLIEDLLSRGEMYTDGIKKSLSVYLENAK